MNDRQFQDSLNDLYRARSEYDAALEVAEAEYIRRFGEKPSDIDDDHWIDCFICGCLKTTVAEVTSNAILAVELGGHRSPRGEI